MPRRKRHLDTHTDRSGRLVPDLSQWVPPHQHPIFATLNPSSTLDCSEKGKTVERGPIGTSSTSTTTLDPSLKTGGPGLASSSPPMGEKFTSALSLLEGLSLSASDGMRSLSPTSDSLSSSSEGSGSAIAASGIPDLVVDTALSLDTLSLALHEPQEPVDLFPAEVLL